MRTILLITILIALCGCTTTYDITLTNGSKIQNVSKPVLDSNIGRYRFSLPSGKEVTIPETRVRLIEPHGDASEPQFVSPTQKK